MICAGAGAVLCPDLWLWLGAFPDLKLQNNIKILDKPPVAHFFAKKCATALLFACRRNYGAMTLGLRREMEILSPTVETAARGQPLIIQILLLREAAAAPVFGLHQQLHTIASADAHSVKRAGLPPAMAKRNISALSSAAK